MVRLHTENASGEERSRFQKSEYLAALTHQMRTPLTALRAGLALVLEQGEPSLPTHMQQMLQLCQRNADYLLKLVNDLLDLHRIEHTAPVLEAVPLAEVVEEVISVLGPLAQRQHITLTAHVPDDLTVHAEREGVGHILTNLIGNALKFSPEGHVNITARREGEHIILRVRDTGIGIPREQLPTLFDPFAYVRQSGVQQGTGLGLAITHALVLRYGGHISVESEEGRGACFTVVLPISSEESPSRSRASTGQLPADIFS